MLTGPSEGMKLFGGHNLPHLVEIELTDLPNLKVPGTPAPPGTTDLAKGQTFPKANVVSSILPKNERWENFRSIKLS